MNFVNNLGIITPSDFSEVGITNGLVGWWPLNGNANDLTEYKNNGAVTGATVVSGLDQLCYSFDGVDDRILVNNGFTSGVNNFSISLWCYLISGVSYYPAFDFGSSPTVGLSLHGILNRLEGGDGTNILDNTSFGSSPSWATWTNVVITYDGSMFYKFLNGVQNATQAWTFGIGSPTSFLIGDFWSTSFKGYIQDVRIYNRALTSEEVKIQYELIKNKVMNIDSTDKLYIAGKLNEVY